MALLENQIKELLKVRSKQATISCAINLEKRVRFHTEANLNSSDITSPSNDFLTWVNTLIPKDKFAVFQSLFKFPLATTGVVEDVYRELERVFSSRNYSANYQFTDKTLSDDWDYYRQHFLKEPTIWKEIGWQKMKTSPNSVLIVDMPTVQTTDKPEPYFYWLDICHVLDYSTKDGHSIDYIIFTQEGEKIAVIDELSYRVYAFKDNEVGALLTINAHELGYCPARFFWSQQLTDEQKELKKNPITKELSNLDWYLFFSTGKQYLDLYAPYPIYSAYEVACDFENNETGEYCDGGFLKNADSHYQVYQDGSLHKCPVCSDKKIAGPGSFIQIPIPSVEDSISDLKNPVQITTIDIDSLDYNVKECERIKLNIITSIIGTNGNVSEKEAINTTQVSANFESKTSVLNNLKTNFERAQKFVEDTVCKLRYGKGFISSAINWGTEFYVYSVEDLYKKYEIAKKNGTNQSELDAISKQILEVEYKNNPVQLQRLLLMKQLEPYRHYTLDEVLSMADKGFLSKEEILLKINFNSYIDRFERENTNLIEFGSFLQLDKKLFIVKQTLLLYVREEKTDSAPVDKTAGGAQNVA